jgi:hypothetical protein
MFIIFLFPIRVKNIYTSVCFIYIPFMGNLTFSFKFSGKGTPFQPPADSIK